MTHIQSSREPTRSRPLLPKGYGVPASEAGMVAWSWAVEQLERARNFWFSTTRPDGRPHAMPAWAVWLDDALYFDGSPETRRGRNLALNPAIVVHLESSDHVVVLEAESAKLVGPPRSSPGASRPRSRPSTAPPTTTTRQRRRGTTAACGSSSPGSRLAG